MRFRYRHDTGPFISCTAHKVAQKSRKFKSVSTQGHVWPRFCSMEEALEEAILPTHSLLTNGTRRKIDLASDLTFHSRTLQRPSGRGRAGALVVAEFTGIIKRAVASSSSTIKPTFDIADRDAPSPPSLTPSTISRCWNFSRIRQDKFIAIFGIARKIEIAD